MKHLGTVRIETERLVLRKFTMDDAEAMFSNYASDPEVSKFLTWPAHADVEGSKKVLTRFTSAYIDEDHYCWAIVPKDNNDRPIGGISVVEKRDDIGMVEIGYCIGRSWWHQGITSEALNAVIRFFFLEVGVNRIQAIHDPRNPNSGKVMMKCKMKYEGTNRQAGKNNQGICDVLKYAILAEDYFKDINGDNRNT
ncbi:MAG: GNAT family N-acetyltransferase [Clostridia bacterium]